MLASTVVLTTAMVTILALVLYFATGIKVVQMRHRHKVNAPAMTGPLEFECAIRVQMNTLEHLPVFVIALWLTAVFFGPYPLIAPILGAVWLVGRVLYVLGYMQAPDKRATGFATATIAELLLVILAFAGVVLAWSATA